MKNNLYEKNLAKFQELQAYCIEPCRLFMKDCFDAGLIFVVTEAFRSTARQAALYRIGRRGITGEKPVTWTMNSNHCKRLAFDCYPEPQFGGKALQEWYRKVEVISVFYGIVRPPELVKLGDLGHFECLTAHLPFSPQLSEADQKKLDSKAISKLSGQPRERAIVRYQKLFGEMPQL